MRDQAIGDVLVKHATGPLGIVTDRDITTRVVANGRDAQRVTVGDVCTTALTTVEVDTPVEEVIALMSSQAVRRIPVMDGERPIGIVSLGDLAVDRDGSVGARPDQRRPTERAAGAGADPGGSRHAQLLSGAPSVLTSHWLAWRRGARRRQKASCE